MSNTVFDTTKLYDFAKDHGFDPEKIPSSAPYNFVLKALHPATSACGPVTGVPDRNNVQTLTFHWRQADSIVPPTALTTGTWDVDYVALPGPLYYGFYRTIASTADHTLPTNWTYGVLYNKQYNFSTPFAGSFAGNNPIISTTTGQWTGPINIGNWSLDISKYRVMYASSTGVLNAASLSDQGMMVAAQGPYDVDFDELVSGQTAIGANPQGVTGTTVSGPNRGTTIGNGAQYRLLTPNTWGAGSALPSYDDILSMSPRAEQWCAKDGFYFPLRFSDGLFSWQDSTDLYVLPDNPWVGTSTTSSAATIAWTAAFPQGPPPGRTMWGYACFRGLAATTTLSITTRVGYECLAGSASNFKAFLTESCEPDSAAIDEYFRISAKMSDVYPSIYNEEDLLSSVISALSAGLSFLPGPWGKAAKLAGPALQGITSLFRKPKSRVTPQKSASAAPQQAAPDDVISNRRLMRDMADEASVATLQRAVPAGRVRAPRRRTQVKTTKVRRGAGRLVAAGRRRR